MTTGYDHSITTQRVAFWHALPGRSAITNDEGMHGVLLFAAGEDPTAAYDERLAYVQELGWLNGGFDEPADLAMQRGTLAQMLVRALEIDGGVMLALTRQHPRYATRELQYTGIYGVGGDLRAISGLEFLAIIARAEAWRGAGEDEGAE